MAFGFLRKIWHRDDQPEEPKDQVDAMRQTYSRRAFLTGRAAIEELDKKIDYEALATAITVSSTVYFVIYGFSKIIPALANMPDAEARGEASANENPEGQKVVLPENFDEFKKQLSEDKMIKELQAMAENPGTLDLMMIQWMLTRLRIFASTSNGGYSIWGATKSKRLSVLANGHPKPEFRTTLTGDRRSFMKDYFFKIPIKEELIFRLFPSAMLDMFLSTDGYGAKVGDELLVGAISVIMDSINHAVHVKEDGTESFDTKRFVSHAVNSSYWFMVARRFGVEHSLLCHWVHQGLTNGAHVMHGMMRDESDQGKAEKAATTGQPIVSSQSTSSEP